MKRSIAKWSLIFFLIVFLELILVTHYTSIIEAGKIKRKLKKIKEILPILLALKKKKKLLILPLPIPMKISNTDSWSPMGMSGMGLGGISLGGLSLAGKMGMINSGGWSGSSQISLDSGWGGGGVGD